MKNSQLLFNFILLRHENYYEIGNKEPICNIYYWANIKGDAINRKEPQPLYIYEK